LVITATAVLVSSCGGGDGDAYTGNLEDFSYGGRSEVTYGPTAAGGDFALERFKGQFVWVDFSAPWCGPCRSQAPVIRSLEHAYQGKVVFVTILVSDDDPRTPASQATARAWAAQYKLDGGRVAAGDDRVRFIPTHVLFSPMGQTLYRKSGVHSEAEVRARLQHSMKKWQGWYDENRNSISVMLGEIGDAAE
jgi:thiol-disulfide isomerase/thioredoxin